MGEVKPLADVHRLALRDAVIDQLEAEAERLRAVLRLYADDANWWTTAAAFEHECFRSMLGPGPAREALGEVGK